MSLPNEECRGKTAAPSRKTKQHPTTNNATSVTSPRAHGERLDVVKAVTHRAAVSR